ncbi:TonB-dependent receptor [Sphingobacteriaceae bacterium WQ 2009]|uniref:TonB-dependent receptor n=1 Tax=Rhinopithecimicrobium faecis TaxID=2820698 RepID=A0A8T4H4I6_9SPHI|nr:TonB-dependent receptor [Sphingobacteriaceae bacterium WQ 2009]
MLKLNTICLTLLIILSLPAFAQQGTLIGKLTNHKSQPIDGASIRIAATTKGTLTDKNGLFFFKSLPYGRYTIHISAVGYKTKELQINLQEKLENSLNIALTENPNTLAEVQIQGKTVARKIKETGFNVNVIETKRFANTNTDINQILNRSTGIRIRQQGGLGSNYSFSLNGLSGDHVKFFIDGIPIESYGSGMSFNNMPVNLAERIEVYKGVVPAHLGSDALGGAINIVTNRDKVKFIDASYSYGSFNTHRAALSAGRKFNKSGLNLNVNTYYNYSNNDYRMRTNPKANIYLEVPSKTVPNQLDTIRSARRFHDNYESFMTQVELGVHNKKYADIAVVGLTFNQVNNQVQTGATQEKVIGGIQHSSNSFTPSIRYRKEHFLLKNLSASLFSNFSTSKSIITDTSSINYYYWDGSTFGLSKTQGELNVKSIRHQKINNSFSQVNLNYQLRPQHVFALNYNLKTNDREEYNEIDPYNDTFNKTNRITQHIVGLNYQQILLKGRLNNSFFLKRYTLAGNSTANDNNSNREARSYTGYGAATNYRIIRHGGVKLSYEHAYRLPSFTELFGNGIEVIGNPNLEPANSDNYNLGLYYKFHLKDHAFSVEASTFYRNAKNYIITTRYSDAERNYSYSRNEGGIKVNGADFEIKYDYKGLLQAMVNMSYYNAVDRARFVEGTNREKITYNSRTPNEPWLFGNADISTGFNNLFGTKHTRLQFNYYLQFVNNYSLSWSKLGDKRTKDYIPEQWLHNLAISYSLKQNKYHITVEGHNLSNEIAYDVFKQQRPGRSIFVKLRYSLQSFK